MVDNFGTFDFDGDLYVFALKLKEVQRVCSNYALAVSEFVGLFVGELQVDGRNFHFSHWLSLARLHGLASFLTSAS